MSTFTRLAFKFHGALENLRIAQRGEYVCLFTISRTPRKLRDRREKKWLRVVARWSKRINALRGFQQ